MFMRGIVKAFKAFPTCGFGGLFFCSNRRFFIPEFIPKQKRQRMTI
jgi:hypothetical protein